ncbi:hypothetical protein MKW94_005544 [Papaver nudicaule]|uniref:UBC core domain-containing protein n=1 Tax=Papaver nudicaule TaxID=74823 RepID=A0AA41W1R4_PAPNU|nr:hypothetical protein [Papaver nudicaule]
MQEWKLLKKGLPDSIYVRVHEERTDLLDAVIMGGAGTPYCDGLFFFQIIFPSNYPNVPPKLHLQTNCFLATHFRQPNGCCIDIRQIKGLQKWNSKKSSILEILKCSTILAILKQPPTFLEEFVSQHFRDRAEAILTACRPYYKVKYGDHPIYETKYCHEYRDSMANMYAKLLKAFIKNGSSLDEYIGDINLEDDFAYVMPPSRPHWVCTVWDGRLCMWLVIFPGMLFNAGVIWLIVYCIRHLDLIFGPIR